MRVVVGLGNPGRQYAKTRHNVGYRAVDALAERAGASWRSTKCSADVAQAGALLVKPTTYMNDSGRAVAAVVKFYQLELDDLLVVCDDLDLGLGRIRLRRSGGSGGQNGLKSIARHLGSQDFARLRIGIGRPVRRVVPEGVIAAGPAPSHPGEIDPADYVLSAFREAEIPVIEAAVERACEAVDCWCSHGIELAMNQFNVEPGAIESPPGG